MKKLALCSLLIATAAPLAAQTDFSKVEIKASKVAGNVYMLQGAGGNIGVSVGNDGILIVDDQFAPLAPKIKASLAGISDKPVRFVLNTHHHGDHTGGNEVFGETAPIIAHSNVRKRLNSPQDGKAPVPASLPVITFDRDLTVHINGETIRAVHFPHGHTDGDSVIFFTESNVVHLGDNFFAGRFPFIDIDSGGSVRGLIRNLDKVIAELPADVKVIPGHGPLATLEDLTKYRVMIEDALKIVDQGMKQGMSLEQLKSDKVLTPYKDWAWGFISEDRFIETLHRELGMEPRQ